MVKKYFSEVGTKSQVLKALAFLIESGSIYCSFMVNYNHLVFLYDCQFANNESQVIHYYLPNLDQARAVSSWPRATVHSGFWVPCLRVPCASHRECVLPLQ